MKKGIAVFFLLVLLVIGSVYVFIPSQITVGSFVTLPGTTPGISRTLQQKDNWEKFWKGYKQVNQSPMFTSTDFYIENEDSFRVAELLHNAIKIDIINNRNAVQSLLTILSVSKDSVVLNWSYTELASGNPYKRIQQYQQALSAKNNMRLVLDNMKSWAGKNENVYGFPITETSISDTLLISTSKTLSHYPTTTDVYTLVNILVSYAEHNEAKITGNPLLNITPVAAQQYDMMVAVPINKILNGNEVINYKRMIPGRFLTTTVTGGNSKIEKANQEMQLYFEDNQRTAMAIPFQVLITDRGEVNDTSGWITKLYFPVM